MTTLNKPDVMPPLSEDQDYYLDAEASTPVLAWDDDQWFVAYATKDIETGKMAWHTDCAENWTVTDSIKGWIPLPPNPTTETINKTGE
jgi:hypothetical protein